LSDRALPAEFNPELQRTFIEAMRLIDARDYEGAIKTLRALAAQTHSPRVKLELARALFYHRDYRESRALFDEVLLDPDTPWQVRDNIEAFLRQIDDAEGYIRFAASVVHDSNPLNITNGREFTIGGFRVTYSPPAQNEPVTGLRYSAQALQPLSEAARLNFYFTGSYLDYEGGSLDRLTADAGLVKGLANGLADAKFGIEFGTFANRPLYQFAYTAGDYTFVRSPSQQVIGGLKLGKVRFPDYPYLDAIYTSATVLYQRAIPERSSASVRATLEYSDAYENAYSYEGFALGPGLTHLFTGPALFVSANVTFGLRRYSAVDPLFGQQRQDRKTTAELQLQNKAWRWRSFKPALLIFVEQNRSNIDFYSYRKVNVAIVVE
jgi:hypothetical protein